MPLYFARWFNNEVSIIHAPNDHVAFHILDEEASPLAAKVWKAEGCAIVTSERIKGQRGLKLRRSSLCRWKRVNFEKSEYY